MKGKYFPINTATSCRLKWSWSSIYLNSGYSASCHRTAHHKLTVDNFDNFHNNSTVVADRISMLNGIWPDTNCAYCRNIEEAGGLSDRIRQTTTADDVYPPELDYNATAVRVNPVILEVFFSNICNLGCVYCSPKLSSVINVENKKYGHGSNENLNSTFDYFESDYNSLLNEFWKWFPSNFEHLRQLHILGGEPLIQKEFEVLLNEIDLNPNQNCVLNIVTNLMVSDEKLEYFIARFKSLLKSRKLKRIDITCSIDCWGIEQEYVRYKLNLQQWEKNFNRLLKEKWITLNINQTISVLTLKTMPLLLQKLSEWKSKRPVNHYFGTVTGEHTYLRANILGGEYWKSLFDDILNNMKEQTDEEKNAKEYMQGILIELSKSETDITEINKLFAFLNEKDRRRGTDWKTVFPWLKEFYNVV